MNWGGWFLVLDVEVNIRDFCALDRFYARQKLPRLTQHAAP